MDTRPHRCLRRHRHLPSKEPRPFSHGYKTPPRRATPSSPTFNGAMAFQPWILRYAAIELVILRMLQWSHGLSAMDTGARPGSRRGGHELQWSHGLSAMDTKMRTTTWSTTKALQWSHGLSAMDTSPALAVLLLASRGFNGAMAFQPWIPDRRRRVVAIAGVASMEPWPFSHGYGAGDGDPTGDWEASMEPWPFSHGYAVVPGDAVRVRIASMEPWPFSHGYVRTMRGQRRARNASMEPWPFSHGYSGNSGTPSLYHTGRVFDSRVRCSFRPMPASVCLIIPRCSSRNVRGLPL